MRRVRLETEYGLEMTEELELGSSSSCSWRRLCQQGSGEQGLKGGLKVIQLTLARRRRTRNANASARQRRPPSSSCLVATKDPRVGNSFVKHGLCTGRYVPGRYSVLQRYWVVLDVFPSQICRSMCLIRREAAWKPTA